MAQELGSRSTALLPAPGVDPVSEMLSVLLGELEALPRPLALDEYHQLEATRSMPGCGGCRITSLTACASRSRR